VSDAGFEVVHEACNRAVVFAAVVGNGAGRKLACHRPARRNGARPRAETCTYIVLATYGFA
jgi:hypothetical protein